jgi:hypothetical protein
MNEDTRYARFNRQQKRTNRSYKIGIPDLRRVRVVGSEIGLDDLRISPHGVWRAVGDHLAVIGHDDAVGELGDHLHVALDPQHGQPQLVLDAQQEAGEILPFFAHQPGGRFIEQQLLIERQRPRHADQLLHAIGKARGRRVAIAVELEEVDDALDGAALRNHALRQLRHRDPYSAVGLGDGAQSLGIELDADQA